MSDDAPGFDAAEARRRALDWLARREYGQHELIGKLTARGCNEQLAAEIVAALAAENKVSDERYVESLVHVRRARGYGPLYIRRELEQKGIDRDRVERALDALAGEWLDDLRRVRARKYGGRRPANLTERARQTRFLQSRGFTHEQIRQVLGSDD